MQIRNCMQQRSRWAKVGYVLFQARRNPSLELGQSLNPTGPKPRGRLRSHTLRWIALFCKIVAGDELLEC